MPGIKYSCKLHYVKFMKLVNLPVRRNFELEIILELFFHIIL